MASMKGDVMMAMPKEIRERLKALALKRGRTMRAMLDILLTQEEGK